MIGNLFSSARVLLGLFSCVFVLACSSPPTSDVDPIPTLTLTTHEAAVDLAPTPSLADLAITHGGGVLPKNCMGCHSGNCPEGDLKDLKTPGVVASHETARDLDVGDRNLVGEVAVQAGHSLVGLCKKLPDLCCPGCVDGVASSRDPAARVDKI